MARFIKPCPKISHPGAARTEIIIEWKLTDGWGQAISLVKRYPFCMEMVMGSIDRETWRDHLLPVMFYGLISYHLLARSVNMCLYVRHNIVHTPLSKISQSIRSLISWVNDATRSKFDSDLSCRHARVSGDYDGGRGKKMEIPSGVGRNHDECQCRVECYGSNNGSFN